MIGDITAENGASFPESHPPRGLSRHESTHAQRKHGGLSSASSPHSFSALVSAELHRFLLSFRSQRTQVLSRCNSVGTRRWYSTKIRKERLPAAEAASLRPAESSEHQLYLNGGTDHSPARFAPRWRGCRQIHLDKKRRRKREGRHENPRRAENVNRLR